MATILVTNSPCLPMIGLFLGWVNKHTRLRTNDTAKKLFHPCLACWTRVYWGHLQEHEAAVPPGPPQHMMTHARHIPGDPCTVCRRFLWRATSTYCCARAHVCLLSCEPPESCDSSPLPSQSRGSIYSTSPMLRFVLCLKGSYLENNNSKKASKHDAVFHHCAKGDRGETALKAQRFSMGQSLRVVNLCSAGFVAMMWGRTLW